MSISRIPLTDRRRARIVGSLFLAAILAYGIGTALTTSVLSSPDLLAGVSAKTPQYAVGAALMVLNSVIVAAIGVLLFPLLARYSRPIAGVYLGGRLVEAVVLVVGVGFLLSLIPLAAGSGAASAADATEFATRAASALDANDVAYQIAMAALGFTSLFFCALLLRARLVPRFLAVWGVVGYAVFFVGAVLELLGATGWGLPLSIVGGLFELVFGVWLIVKGFNSRPVEVPAERSSAAA